MMLVSWANVMSDAPSNDTMYRLPSRTKVIAVSLRTHRGFVSATDVRVMKRRVPLVASYRTTSAAFSAARAPRVNREGSPGPAPTK